MRAAAVTDQRGKGSSKYGAKRRLRMWLCFVLIFVVWAIYIMYTQSVELTHQVKQLAGASAQQQASQTNLDQMKYEVKRLQDPEYIGQIARKKYGLYKPGETPILKSSNGN